MTGLRYRPWFIKLRYSEFWPMWLYYIPVWVQHFWLALRVKSLFYFLGTNPAIDGFILSDSKFKTLGLVPNRYRPKSILIQKADTLAHITRAMGEQHLTYPIIVKPDIGFRGIKVSKIDNQTALTKVLTARNTSYIVQEFIKDPVELGIFYYRYPNESKGHIPSITVKEFLKVTGNGQDTLQDLVQKNKSAVLVKDNLKKRFENQWDAVLEKGQTMDLECIGNHNRGTKFINGNHLVDEALLQVFDELSHAMVGFYYGRFDVKATSLEAIKNRDFKILEVNGVGGEPTHIYDSRASFFSNWQDLCFVWRVAARIASINFAVGVERPSFREAYLRWMAYRRNRADLDRES